MKIGLVCPYDFQALGGVQTHIRELARALVAKGHEVKILAPRSPNGRTEDTLPTGSCLKIKFSQTAFEITWLGFRELVQFRERLRQEKFDLLHFHTIWNPFMPLQLFAISNTRSVATFHDTAPDTFLGKILSWTLMPAASAILRGFLLDDSIAVSASQWPHLTRLYKGRLRTIPNGVDCKTFRPGASEPLAQYMDGKFNLLYLGRLEERKGISCLLEAYRALKQSRGGIRLLVAGDGYLREDLHRFVVSHALQDVELLGEVDEETKRRLYSTCDVFCSPAFGGESFGIVLLEAMASGKPAVGAANSGYRCVLKGEGEALLVPPRDVEGLVKKLEELHDDVDLRERLSRWGLEQAANYDWSIVAGKILDFYQESTAGA